MGEVMPRLLRTEDAAEYCAVSVSAFHKEIAPRCRKIHPVGNRVAWLRDDLDAYIDERAGIFRSETIQDGKRINPLEAILPS